LKLAYLCEDVIDGIDFPEEFGWIAVFEQVYPSLTGRKIKELCAWIINTSQDNDAHSTSE
jgi:hypothetical protein